MMKLTKDQLQQISAFISKRGFTYYDLQLEIIDHVACKVEELLTANSTLSLDAAIHQTHDSFGVHGFSVFEDAMTQSLQKTYWRLFRQKFLSYLNWKYLPLIGGFIYLIYLVANAINEPDLIGYSNFGLLFVLLIAYIVNHYQQQKKYKRMLTAQMGGVMLIVLNLPFQLFNIVNGFTNHNHNLSTGANGVVQGVLIAFIIICFVTLQQLQKTAIENCRKLAEQYQLTTGN